MGCDEMSAPSIYDMRPDEIEADERIRREEIRETVAVVVGGALLGLLAFALMMI